jgi:NAD(P)-dependent dehydrogenase (short-subunit alcohol dehydrogenase family)
MLPEKTFEDRVAIVTGGGSGIGEAIAGSLARLGASVALFGRTREKLDRACTEIETEGGTARAWVVDVRDRDAVQAAVQDVVGELGHVDHLVNNAAGNFRVAPEEMSPNAWESVVRIVLHGSWHCSQVVGQHMIERGRGGSILNIGSTMSWQGGPDTAHSASAKAGVLTMTRSLAAAWGKYGIRANVLVPGMTEGTAGIDVLLRSPEARQEALARVPLGRAVTKQEIAHAACYLLSDYAAYVTGTKLVMDGGRSLGML